MLVLFLDSSHIFHRLIWNESILSWDDPEAQVNFEKNLASKGQTHYGARLTSVLATATLICFVE